MVHFIDPVTKATYCGSTDDAVSECRCDRAVRDLSRAAFGLPPFTDEEYERLQRYLRGSPRPHRDVIIHVTRP